MVPPRPPNVAFRKVVRAVALQQLGYGLFLMLLFVPVYLAKCPNWCSQHGICTGPGDDAFCICEMGFQGDDCGTRLCPKGDDPLTTDQADRVLLLRTTAEEGPISGELTVTFNGESTTLNADARQTGDLECASALQMLPNIDRVGCQRGAVSEFGGTDYVISLQRFPTTPWENNLYGHSGNPALEAFSCNMSSEADSGISPSCELIDVVTENVKEYMECSGHGRCERETGRCECTFGFGGEACDDISDSDDAQVILAEGPFFTGATLKLRANRGLSPDYDLVRAIAGPHDVMTLTGAGDLVLHEGSLHIQPPASIYPGLDPVGTDTTFLSKEHPLWNTKRPPKALTVSGGSLSVRGGGAEVLSTRGNAPGLLVSVGPFDWDDLEGGGGDGTFHGNGTDRRDEERAFSYAGAALAVNVRESGPGMGAESFRLLELSVGGKGASEEENNGGQKQVLLSVGGDGRVLMAGGGGVVLEEGDLEVSGGGAAFKGNVLVGSGLGVGDGGISVSSGGSVGVTDGRLEVSTTSSVIPGPADPTSLAGAVGAISASNQEFSGDVLRLDAGGSKAAAAGAVLLRASAAGQDVFEVKATGATSIKAGGLDVDAGGLKVGSGGAIISSGGLTVDGGLVLRSGTLSIQDDGGGGDRSGGFEVAHGGIRAASSDVSTSAITASAVNAGFGGVVVSVSAPEASPSNSFRLLQATVGGGNQTEDDNLEQENERQRGEEVFVVDGTGRVTATGGLETGPSGNLVAKGGLVSGGTTILEQRRAARLTEGAARANSDGDEGGAESGDEGSSGVEVDASLGTFFEVPDDGRAGSRNILRIKGGASGGQILVLRNSDADPTSGDAIIPPGYTVLFIHDGSSWRDVRVLEADVRELRGVSSFTAAADLDIGEFSLTARHLVSSANQAGGVAVFGGGGLLTSDKGLSWDAQTRTLTVPRLQASEASSPQHLWVSEGMDFKGRPARNIALVNATIDRIPFLKTNRLMLETGTDNGSGASKVGPDSLRSLSTVVQPSGPEYGLGVFDKKGELSRAEGVTVFPGGIVDVRGLGPHLQHGDIDFQGFTARNISLSGVSSITGLDRLEVRGLFVGALPPGETTDNSYHSGNEQADPEGRSSIAILKGDGELLSAGEAFSVNPVTGTLLAPRLGPHEVTGDVDLVGNTMRNAVLESPEIRGTVSSLETSNLKVSVQASVSRGHLAVFSSQTSEDEDRSTGSSSKALGLASGGGGLAWQDGALQDVRLGGTTTLEGNLDLGGHRLLNFNYETPDLEHVDELTIRRTLKLDKHSNAHPLGEVLVVSDGGSVAPADPATLSIKASSASIAHLTSVEQLTCQGHVEINGEAFIAGGVSIDGEVGLSAGLDARGTGVINARLKNATFEGAVAGDVDIDGRVKIGALKTKKQGARPVVVVGDGGELTAAEGLGFNDEEGIFVTEQISGHKVTGTVDFGGEALLSPVLNFTVGGGVSGLPSLSVGDGGLSVDGVLSTASDVIIEGSVTVSGAVMGRGPYMDTSDARMKMEVKDIAASDAMAVIKGLRAVTYVLKPEALPPSRAGNAQKRPHGDRRQHGFIAQEVEQVAPEVVAEDGNGYKTVAYARLVPTLATALSAALDRLDRLEEAPASTSLPASMITENESFKASGMKPIAGRLSNAITGSGSGYGASSAGIAGGRPAVSTQRSKSLDGVFQEEGHIGQFGLKPGVSDLMQLSEENHALRTRVGEMEKRMAALERSLANVPNVEWPHESE
ncbi:unnamed protein product [Ectocarpus fasciculatus]